MLGGVRGVLGVCLVYIRVSKMCFRVCYKEVIGQYCEVKGLLLGPLCKEWLL